MVSMRKSKYRVYIIECADGTYYTGYTNDMKTRIKLHAKGKGAKYTRGKSPIKLVYMKEYRYFKNALHAERNIKKYTRQRKEELIKSWANTKLNAGAPMLSFSQEYGVKI